jgi:CRISPR/Cas system-associated exonuclease Cas4 (RecB family)
LFLDANGIWNIVDYKTSVNPSAEAIKRYEFQLRFYCYLIMKLYDVKIVKAHLYFSATGKIVSITVTESELSEIHVLLSSTVKSILQDIHSDSMNLLIKNREHCKDCQYSVDRKIICIADTNGIN